MIELVLIAVMLIAMGGVAFAAISSALSAFKLDGAATRIINDLRYAQHLARTHNEWHGVELIANPTNVYRVYYTDGLSDADVVDPVNPTNALSVDVQDEYGGVIILAVDIAGGTQVEFNPLGEPYDDKEGAPLASTGTITLWYNGTSKVIRIIQSTGRVELQ